MHGRLSCTGKSCISSLCCTDTKCPLLDPFQKRGHAAILTKEKKNPSKRRSRALPQIWPMMGTLAPNQTGDSPLMLLPANDALSLALTMPAEGMAVLINNRLEHCVQELGAEAACSLLIRLCAQCAPTKWGRLAPAIKSAVVKVFVLFLVYVFTCYPCTRDTCACSISAKMSAD